MKKIQKYKNAQLSCPSPSPGTTVAVQLDNIHFMNIINLHILQKCRWNCPQESFQTDFHLITLPTSETHPEHVSMVHFVITQSIFSESNPQNVNYIITEAPVSIGSQTKTHSNRHILHHIHISLQYISS